MSCILEHVATISKCHEMRQWLCPHFNNGSEENSLNKDTLLPKGADGWSEDWGSGWDDIDKGGGEGGGEGGSSESQQNVSEPNHRASPAPPPVSEASWLSECTVAASPTADLIAVGYKNRMVLLASRWENTSEGEKMTLSGTWRGTIGFSENDEISDILCLPLISQKQSGAGGPDWTCVIVGFSSGHVAMYTENGLLLLSQLFEEGAVLSIKCRTNSSSKGASLVQDMSEELVFLYPRAITSIDGFSLCQTLRGCRSQVAKAAASGGESVSVPPLGYKKWGFVDQVLVMDCVAPGVNPPVVYDYLMEASIAKKMTVSLNSGVPATSQLLTVGEVPYVGYLSARDGSAPPFVADVVNHYAHKLKDALVSAASGWLFGRNNKNEEKIKKPKIEPAVPLPYISSIPDKRRIGVTVDLSPSRKLAAVTDDFGRVTVIDMLTKTALRMWKGYRDAGCGWLEVEGEWGGSKRCVNFLVIYAPRRGLLEIWTPQQGARVAAFNVPKYSKLLYIPHTLLGVNSVRGVRCRVFPVLFITPEGNINEISVPFHLALGGKTSKRARDLHLLKTLKMQMRSGSEEEVLQTLAEIKTIGVRKQALAQMTASQHITTTLLKGMLELLLPIYGQDQDKQEGDEGQKLDHESRLLGQYLLRLHQLLQLYNCLTELNKAREASPDPDDTTLIEELSKQLMLNLDETKEALMNTEENCLIPHATTRKVKFSSSSDKMSIGSFVRCWDTAVGTLVKDAIQVLPINLKADITSDKKSILASYLYGWAWHRESVTSFSFGIQESGIEPEVLLHLALDNWGICPIPETVAVLHLGTIIYTLSSLAGEIVLCDIGELSGWWSKVRDMLVTWTQPHHAYLVALLCRGVHARLESNRQIPKTNYDDEQMEEGSQEDCKVETQTEEGSQDKCKAEKHQFSSLNEWDSLSSMELVEWNLLISQLEHLLPLDQLLKFKTPYKVEISSNLKVSIKGLLDKGKGHVTELVGSWLVSSGLRLSVVVKLLKQNIQKPNTDLDDEYVEMETEETLEDSPTKSEITEIDMSEEEQIAFAEASKLIAAVSKKFPNSLSPDAVLTDMFWTLGATWHKDPNDINKLSLALEFIASIGNSHVRHGILLMAWETWVAQRIQSSVALMEKVGRMPKDRLCRRDIGLGEHVLPFLFQSARNLLSLIMEANVVCEVEKASISAIDTFWSRQEEGSPSLVELAVTQKVTCYDLVFHHHQLLTVLYLIAQYTLKNVKALSYFDGKGRSVFFKPLTTKWTLTPAEPQVSNPRLSFLCRVITSAVTTLPDNSLDNQGAISCVRHAIDLGREWEVTLDTLHRHHVCELYNSGLDSLAEEVLPTVSDGVALGSQLVMIAGQRLHYLISTSTQMAHHVALTSPTITTWIKSCDNSDLRCPDIPLEITLNLLTRAINLLPEVAQEYKMANALYQTLTAFSNDQLHESS